MNYCTLQSGDCGDDVIELKKRLMELGYFRDDSKMTNRYNDTLVGRVKMFQRQNGFEETGIATPDMQVLLMFIIPVKMKWMAVFYVVIVAYEMIQYIMAGAWYLVIPIVASLLNFIIFYFGTKDFSRYNPKEIHRRNEFRRAMEPQGRMKSGSGSVTKHKCAICGRTELDDPNLEFRFCSRCNGNYEYCQDHLFTHTHVK